jgi:hypothetical protein
MQAFLNEFSCHQQFYRNTIENALHCFLYTMTSLKKNYPDIEYFSSKTIFHKHLIAGVSFDRIIHRNSEINRLIFANLDNLEYWEDNPSHSYTDGFLWNQFNVSGTSLAELAERSIKNISGFLVNFIGSCFDFQPQITVEKNNTCSVNLHCVYDDISAYQHLVNIKLINPLFTYTSKKDPPSDHQTVLRNQTVFTPINLWNQGRRVYNRIGTGELWVIDNKHAGAGAHIEIFDEITRKHLGTSSISTINLDIRYK